MGEEGTEEIQKIGDHEPAAQQHEQVITQEGKEIADRAAAPAPPSYSVEEQPCRPRCGWSSPERSSPNTSTHPQHV
ncbi:unnamed protein product [Vitrella brassicaformis CCMP3155]|uniref:Uncharacterized protein n=1 Tax=Vitrella brassicaformis (strain CCMP3155) TaxID=1169540 RepID=A0A0G4H3H4_VITBC|nr:unnamed protein product [Vitrella brassicaformis CCMP3155]|eukprot:CEM38263.1 unnamed protein product [Vitrella brassicaformis CCMP3155]